MRSAIFAALLFMGAAQAAVPAAIFADPPADKAHPAAMSQLQIASGGLPMNAVFYTAAGAKSHPTILLLHGFPGNEQNLDLAQVLRRAGFHVLTFHYRGSWGSPGNFSFQHCLEDTAAALAFLRDPVTTATYRIDSGHIFVVGHSMGGFLAEKALASNPGVAGAVMISAWDVASTTDRLADPKLHDDTLQRFFTDNLIPLSGTSAKALIGEIESQGAAWRFTNDAKALAPRPLLLITAEDETEASSHGLAQAVRAAGGRQVREIHMQTDHPYSDHRIALEAAILSWLQAQTKH